MSLKRARSDDMVEDVPTQPGGVLKRLRLETAAASSGVLLGHPLQQQLQQQPRSLKRRHEDELHPELARVKLRRHEDQMLVHHDPEEKLDPTSLQANHGLFSGHGAGQQLPNGHSGGALFQNGGQVNGHFGGHGMNGATQFGQNGQFGGTSGSGHSYFQSSSANSSSAADDDADEDADDDDADDDDMSMSDGVDAHNPPRSAASTESLALIPVSQVMDGEDLMAKKLSGVEIRSLLNQQDWRSARDSSGLIASLVNRVGEVPRGPSSRALIVYEGNPQQIVQGRIDRQALKEQWKATRDRVRSQRTERQELVQEIESATDARPRKIRSATLRRMHHQSVAVGGGAGAVVQPVNRGDARPSGLSLVSTSNSMPSTANSQYTNPEGPPAASYLPTSASASSCSTATAAAAASLHHGMSTSSPEEVASPSGIMSDSPTTATGATSLHPANPEEASASTPFDGSGGMSSTPFDGSGGMSSTPFDGTGMPFMSEQMAPLATFPGRTTNANVGNFSGVGSGGLSHPSPLPLHLAASVSAFGSASRRSGSGNGSGGVLTSGQTLDHRDLSQSMADYYSRSVPCSGLSSLSSSGSSSSSGLPGYSRRTQVHATNGRTTVALQKATEAMSAMDLGDD